MVCTNLFNYYGKNDSIMRPTIRRAALIAAVFFVCSLNLGNLIQAQDDPTGELTIELSLEESDINLSQNIEPYTFRGWVNWTGISVMPFTVHLIPTCDIGNVFLSQYDFTFQLPDSIPFDGLIVIEPEKITLATAVLTMNGYVDEGGLRYSMTPTSYILPIRFYKEDEPVYETVEHNDQDNVLLLRGITGLMMISVVAIVFTRRKMKKT